MRVNARLPWRVDCPLNPKKDGRWVSKRDYTFVADLDEVTWVADDEVREAVRRTYPEHPWQAVLDG
jgi:hypothetical protein